MAIANKETTPTHLCVSGGSLFIGTLRGGTFFVCRRILGSTVDSSLVSSLVQDSMNYTHGENVVKMVPCAYDLPLQDRQELVKEILEPVFKTYFD